MRNCHKEITGTLVAALLQYEKQSIQILSLQISYVASILGILGCVAFKRDDILQDF